MYRTVAVVMEENPSWRTLVNLQIGLHESKERNTEFSKQIHQLQAAKEKLNQDLERLCLSSKKETAESIFEDRETVSLSQEREKALTREKSLKNDLKSARNLLGKIKLDIDHRNKSIAKLEVQCAETKASIAMASVERCEDLRDIESMRSYAEEQRSIIVRLSNNTDEERILGERLKKRNLDLKEIQIKLERQQHRQEQRIVKLHDAIQDTRLKSMEANKILKRKLRDLRVHSREMNRAGVRLIRLKKTTVLQLQPLKGPKGILFKQ